MHWSDALGRRSRRFWIVTSFTAIVLLGSIDYATGSELSFSIFYLFPISLLAWFVGFRTGIVASFVGAASWFLDDMLADTQYTYPATPYWNAFVRFGVFLIVVLILSSLRAAKRRQEDLLHLMIHDLRSPLTNVMMGLQLMQTSPAETPDAQQLKVMDICVTSCQWMLRLINSVLDLARLESGQLPLRINNVRVEELVETSLDQVRLWAAQTPVHLTTSLEAVPRETVRADAEMTVRILTNLLSNAIKFSPSETTITIHVAPAPEGMVAFSITDQGKGVPKEWTQKVFDKYAQVDVQKKTGLIGSGLGLAFCRQAIEAQQGQIWLESEVGHGTTVTFTLPSGTA